MCVCMWKLVFLLQVMKLSFWFFPSLSVHCNAISQQFLYCITVYKCVAWVNESWVCLFAFICSMQVINVLCCKCAELCFACQLKLLSLSMYIFCSTSWNSLFSTSGWIFHSVSNWSTNLKFRPSAEWSFDISLTLN